MIWYPSCDHWRNRIEANRCQHFFLPCASVNVEFSLLILINSQHSYQCKCLQDYTVLPYFLVTKCSSLLELEKCGCAMSFPDAEPEWEQSRNLWLWEEVPDGSGHTFSCRDGRVRMSVEVEISMERKAETGPEGVELVVRKARVADNDSLVDPECDYLSKAEARISSHLSG